MDKSSTQQQQKVNLTCPCGEQGKKSITATLKNGTQQAYCSTECKEMEAPKQKK